MTQKSLPKVFIVGESGTTGLRLHDRLSGRKDIDLLSLPEDKKKDIDTIVSFAKEADIMFLCLPDDASGKSSKPPKAQASASSTPPLPTGRKRTGSTDSLNFPSSRKTPSPKRIKSQSRAATHPASFPSSTRSSKPASSRSITPSTASPSPDTAAAANP